MRRAASSPPELPGYTFVKVLGSGGFSDVFLYDQQLPKRRVAVKVLLTEDLAPATRAAFVAEANLMAQLSAHPYIVSIFHADVASDDRPYFVMEYCSGPSLAERYKSEPLSVTDVLRTGVRVAGAVATAHSAGILHRDIKPANVLTNDYGWPALTDFGISSALDDELPLHTSTLGELTADADGTTGASVGMSVPWSPPEMFEDDPNPDVRADVFSLAATLYTLLAGHTPFEVRGRSNGVLDLIGRIERGAITPFERDDIPRSLVAVLQKGMASNREDRFSSAVEFARALQRVELELNYAPTTIDVPNLIVDDSVRDGADDGDDATRVRGVATIEAQPIVRAEAQPTVSAVTPPSVDDATQVRGAQLVAAQPAAEVVGETVVRRRPTTTIPTTTPTPTTTPPPAPPVVPEAGVPASRANRLVLWIGGGVAAVITVAVVVGLIVLGQPGQGDSDPTDPTPGGGSAVVESVPTPVLVSASASAGSVVFTVNIPKPEDGDRLIWQRIGSESEPVRESDDGIITVDGYSAGSDVCVDVWVVRDGTESANPLEACFPE